VCTLVLGLTAVVVLSWPLSLSAGVTIEWGGTDGNWNDDTKWIGGAEPTINHFVDIDNGTCIVSEVGEICTNIYIARQHGQSGYLLVTGGTLDVVGQAPGGYGFFVGGQAESSGTVHQTGGKVTCGKLWAIGKDTTASWDNRYILDGGELELNSTARVGYHGHGQGVLIINGGLLDMNGAVFWVGYDTGHGRVYLNGGELETSCAQWYGCYSVGDTALMVQNGGTNDCNNSMYIPYVGTGEYVLSNGVLDISSRLYVGFGDYDPYVTNAFGTFRQSGGSARVNRSMYLGYAWFSTGTVYLTGGKLHAASDAGDGLFVGYGHQGSDGSNTEGRLYLSDSNGTTQLELGNGDLVVRDQAGAVGTIRGWMTNIVWTGTGNLENNGRIIADGDGNDRTLKISGYTSFANPIDNVSFTDTSGWYAENGGKLVLKPLTVAVGNNDYNWGEASGDSTIDLVNSMRMAFSNVAVQRTVTGSLLATDRTDIPSMSGNLQQVLTIWHLGADAALTFDSLILSVRYDENARVAAGIPTGKLQLFKSTGGAWSQLPTTITTAQGGQSPIAQATITSLGGDNTSTYFALGRPPAGTLVLIR